MRIPTIVCLLLLACSACGPGRDKADPASPPQLATELAGLPDSAAEQTEQMFSTGLLELPGAGSPVSVSRRVSDTQARINGDAAAAAGGGNNHADPLSGILAIIPSGEDDLAWAVYTLPGLNLERPVELLIEAQAIIPSGEDDLAYWVLYSDYSSMRWRMTEGPNADGSFSGPASVMLNSVEQRERVVSAAGVDEPTFSYAIVTIGNADNSPGKTWDEQPRVEISHGDTTLRNAADPEYLSTLPHQPPLTSVKSGLALEPEQHVTLTWDLIGDPVNNFANEAQGYEVWRKQVTGVQNLRLGSVGPGVSSFTDPLDSDPGRSEPEPGRAYIYYARAVNAAGHSVSATRRIHPGGWSADVVDRYFGNLSGATSVASIHGRPGIAYRTNPGGVLRFAIESATGSGEWQIADADTGASIGWDAALALINGRPAISHYDNALAKLKYSYSEQPDGQGNWTTITIDETGTGGNECSLALVSGHPAISYYDSANLDLKYARSSSADGLTGWNTLTVDEPGSVGRFSSLTVLANGCPAISYHDAAVGASKLKFAWSSTATGDGPTDWNNLTVDAAANAVFTSMAVVNGVPAIAYYCQEAHELRYAWCNIAGGDDVSEWNTLVVDNVRLSALSLAVVGGVPCICYHKDDFPAGLKYARSAAANGSGGWAVQTVDAENGSGSGPSLAAVGGRGVISYHAVDPDDPLFKQVRRALLDP